MSRFDGCTAGGALALAAETLSDIKEISTPYLDALVIMTSVSGHSKARLLSNRDEPLSVKISRLYDESIRRREALEPVQYITNSCEFMGLPFYVDKNVLIPRPETEHLVEKAIELISERGYKRVLDMCTGSGCVAVAVAHYCEAARVTAVDISQPALDIARKNAEALSVARGVGFIHSDMFDNLPAGESFDILLCNPPYVSGDEMKTLGANVKYEPEAALFGGADGLDFYRRIAEKYEAYIRPGGAVLLEIGAAQGEAVKSLFGGGEILKDYAKLDRVYYKTIGE